MPLFTVTEGEKIRLIEAKSREGALDFVTRDRFVVDIVRRPAEVAKLYAQGVVLEDSATKPAEKAPEQQPEQQHNEGDGKDGETAANDPPSDPPPATRGRGAVKPPAGE